MDSGDSRLTSKLCKHYEVVFNLMKNGHNWRDYDEGFRRKVETEKDVNFGCIHFELYFAAQSQVFSQRLKPVQKCLNFNSPKGCYWTACKYLHSCSKCNKPHSVLQCPINQFVNRQGGSQLVRFPSPQSSNIQDKVSFPGYSSSFRSQQPYRPRTSQYSVSRVQRQ